ncbi:hypothetical protein [Ruminococcus flavefaciens]|uniref:Uncharacterized protein n=1 Tax=Ruminococcus flavefaciens 007c TaxID=1341157 RepID=W7UUX3_RUMFL|nr:hypothetical protein [Ruminococcus flavefaciens]EWM54964.1 hypothetical protein RF007C_02935 [Ruminococcus flavefaciens 007c]
MNSFESNLQSFVDEYKLIDETWKSFWKNYNSYIIEDKDEALEMGMINKESIVPDLYSIAYKKIRETKEVIVVTIEIHDTSYRYLGYYDAVYNINGEFEDDFFVIK